MIWIQVLQRHKIIQYRIIHSIMSLKLVEQCSVNDGRTTHTLITHILRVCVLNGSHFGSLNGSN